METIIRIRSNELTPEFLNKIKALFNKDEELEISISPVSYLGETKFIKAVRNMQQEAKANGLTQEKLDELLKEE